MVLQIIPNRAAPFGSKHGTKMNNNLNTTFLLKKIENLQTEQDTKLGLQKDKIF